jgi:hypothetical protein
MVYDGDVIGMFQSSGANSMFHIICESTQLVHLFSLIASPSSELHV